MKEKISKILMLILVVVFVYKLIDISAAYKTMVETNTHTKVEPWVVFVNNENVATTQVKSFALSNIMVENENVKLGKMAPGVEFQIPIEIDATKMSKIAVRYDITVEDLENIPIGIKIQDVTGETEGLEIIKTGENTYTGVVTEQDIINDVKHKVMINMIWENDETNNEIDTSFGTSKESISFQVPVKITVAQYAGEEIIEYTEGI